MRRGYDDDYIREAPTYFGIAAGALITSRSDTVAAYAPAHCLSSDFTRQARRWLLNLLWLDAGCRTQDAQIHATRTPPPRMMTTRDVMPARVTIAARNAALFIDEMRRLIQSPTTP